MKIPENQVRTWPIRRIAGRAFTLIELLLVLVILATLAAIVVPKFAGYGQKAKIDSCKIQINNFKVALGMFEVGNQRYPTTEEGLRALVEAPSNCPNWNPNGYLEQEKAVFNDPWDNPYQYEYPGSHNTKSFDLWSWGPDVQNGSSDDITNWEQK